MAAACGTPSRKQRSALHECLLGISFLVAGCRGIPIPGAHGEIHYLIVGLGLATIEPESEHAVRASDVHALGLFASQHPVPRVALGYASAAGIEIPDGARDVRVSVARRPGGPLEVEAQCVLLSTVGREAGIPAREAQAARVDSCNPDGARPDIAEPGPIAGRPFDSLPGERP